jgi:hypothetical protein
VNDPGVRAALREALGFCSAHARELAARPDRLAVAILYEDLLQRVEQEMEAWSHPRRRRVPRPCRACETADRDEEEALAALAAFIDDPELAAAYRSSAGLCLEHTFALCRRLKPPKRARVVAEERDRIARLRAEVREFIRKNDYRFRGEPWGDEKTAPQRAVQKLAGDANS